MSRIKICKEEPCHNAATTDGYCRLHYLQNWKTIKEQKRSKVAKKLNRYIEYMVAKHPDDYVEAIKKDIRSPESGRLIDVVSDDELTALFNEEQIDEEIDKLVRQLKIEKGF